MIHLQRQIEKIKKQLLGLGAAVEEQVHEAIRAIQARDVDMARVVREGDKRIDLLEIDIEEECLHTLALHQPVAFDLRYLVAVLKINHDLERIGDHASNLAEQAEFLAAEAEVDEWPYNLSEMGALVQSMLRKALDALVNVETERAWEVRRLDDQVDEIHRGMYNRITVLMRENPGRIEQYIHLLVISRQLERIADHAVNIAKDVLYMAEGEIMRHSRVRGLASAEPGTGRLRVGAA